MLDINVMSIVYAKGRGFIVMLSVVMLNVVVPLWSDCLQLNNKAKPSERRVFANGASSFSQLAISSKKQNILREGKGAK
jgi:hypothetical protein